jgi:hypothetical protein
LGPPANAGIDAPLFRVVRRLSVAEDGGHFGWSLAAIGDRLVVGAPNLDGAGLYEVASRNRRHHLRHALSDRRESA